MPVTPASGNASASGLHTYVRLLHYVRGYWFAFVIAIVGMMLQAGTEAGFAWLMKPMIDGSFVDRDPDSIRFVPLALLGIFLLRGVGNFSATYFMAWVGWRMIKTLRRQMFAQLLHLPTADYDRSSSGELISKLTFNVERVAGAATEALTVVVRDSLTILALLGVMFYHNALLAMVLLVIAPLITVLVVFISRQFRRTSRKIQQSMGKVTHVVEEAIEGHRVVKIFGGQAYESAHFEAVNERNRRLRMRMVVAQATSVPVIQFIVAAALAAIIYLATVDAMIDSFSAGTFVSFITAMLMLFAPLKRLTTINAKVQTGIAASQSVFELLDSAIEPDGGGEVLENPGVIEYRDVHFSYDRAKGEVLRGISLRIEPGQTVAFVGRSGSGKSTLVNLLARLYEPDAGVICIDGRPIGEFSLTSLRANIAYVGQEVTLFNDTILNNIAYGALGDAGEERVRQAAEAAHAAEFIEAMPQRYETLVGENGVLLSGGQRQRIAIARALLKNAPLLILDEATSSLDTESERYVQAGLQALVANRTTLVIAHRLSTVERADAIVVLDAGQVVETGTHAQLLAAGRRYATLYRMQFSDPDEPEASAEAAGEGA